MVPMNGVCSAAFRAMTPAGTDQARTQATVRHGTNQRASGLAWAASVTATGSRITEYSQVWFPLPAKEKITTPQSATETDAPTVRRPWVTATIP
jgi:hypothetical protein